MPLDDLGWDETWAREIEPWAGKAGFQPGRVIIGFNYLYRVGVEDGEVEAMLAGRLKHRAESRGELPAVGDWVVLRKQPDEDRGAIVAVLPRRSRFSRRMAGNVTDEQVVAANVDVVFIVMALDARLQHPPARALPADGARERRRAGGPADEARPVSRICRHTSPRSRPSPATLRFTSSARSSIRASNRSRLPRPAAAPRALLGSSGVGKSTIINRLVGSDVQKTREVRDADSKGRHTTTHRELVSLPSGGLIIDTPGMRELQLWDAGDSVRETFDDVEALARRLPLHRLPPSRRAAMRGEGRGRGRAADRGPSRPATSSCRTSSRFWPVSRTSARRSKRSAGRR